MEKRDWAVYTYIKRRCSQLFGAEIETEALQRHRVKTNITYGQMIIKTIIAFQVCFIALAGFVRVQHAAVAPKYPYFIMTYCLMVLINLGVLTWFRRFDPQRASRSELNRFDRNLRAYCSFLMAWGIGLTLMGQHVYSSLTLFFMNLIVVTAIFKHPKQTLNRFFLFSLPVLLVLLPFFQKSFTQLGGHYVNATAFTAIFWFISHQMHNSFREHFSVQNELVKSVETLEVIAFEDQLTGLPNRRGLDNYLKQLEGLRHLENAYLCILLIDIDCFKQYNDTLGHLAGDEALKKVADALRDQQASMNEYALRYGGEEFLFLSVQSSPEGFAAQAEAIRKAVEALNIHHPSSMVGIRVTISIGGVWCKLPLDRPVNELLEASDSAMYQAKHSGRNRVCWEK